MYIKSMLMPHLEYAAAVWAPRAPDDIFSSYNAPRAATAAVDKNSPFNHAVALQRRMAVYLLRRSESSRPGRLNLPTALVYAETGWAPLAIRWEYARLRLVGNVICAPAAHPIVAVAKMLTADALPRPNAATPAHAWNWTDNVRAILKRVDEHAPTKLQLSQHINFNTWRPHRVGADASMSTTKWRSKVRDALFGPGGYVERKYCERIRENPDYAGASRAAASAPPTNASGTGLFDTVDWDTFTAENADGPPHVGVFATARSVLDLSRTPARFGKRGMPAHRAFGSNSIAERRLELLCTGQLVCKLKPDEYLADRIAEAGGRGFMYGRPICNECPGSISHDAYHAIAECPRFDVLRRAALDAAAISAAAHRDTAVAQCYRDVSAALHTSAGRTFVFLATLGVTVADEQLQRCLPQWWARCLGPPGKTKGGTHDMGAAVKYTFPAFAELALACLRHAQPAVPAIADAPIEAAAPDAAVAAQAPPPAVLALKQRRSTVTKGAKAAAAAAALTAATATLKSITRAQGWPALADVRALEEAYGADFDADDPRIFHYAVEWSNGVKQTLGYATVEAWAEFRSYALANSNGRGERLFEMPETLENEMRLPVEAAQ